MTFKIIFLVFLSLLKTTAFATHFIDFKYFKSKDAGKAQTFLK